ncbi:MAG: hypothetical protein DHS20C15_26430 [Planctomycetota bacterium]|nr:MAG: hypothetical protein DHS20C15_26430 [Planctomycetota bacterium]
MTESAQAARTHPDVEESAEEQGQLLRMLAHELRGSARTLTQFSQLLSERLGSSADESTTRMLGFLRDGGAQVRSVIDGLMEFEAARAPLESTQRLDITDVLELVLQGESELNERLMPQLELGPLAPVEANPERLTRCLRHLLHNAATYTQPDTEAHVRLEAVIDGEHWHLRCHDEGPGIAADAQERIWLPFRRLYSWAEHPGCGLGLLTARRHARAHGGELSLEHSTLGEGSTFLLSLPRAPSTASPTP